MQLQGAERQGLGTREVWQPPPPPPRPPLRPARFPPPPLAPSSPTRVVEAATKAASAAARPAATPAGGGGSGGGGRAARPLPPAVGTPPLRCCGEWVGGGGRVWTALCRRLPLAGMAERRFILRPLPTAPVAGVFRPSPLPRQPVQDRRRRRRSFGPPASRVWGRLHALGLTPPSLRCHPPHCRFHPPHAAVLGRRYRERPGAPWPAHRRRLPCLAAAHLPWWLAGATPSELSSPPSHRLRPPPPSPLSGRCSPHEFMVGSGRGRDGGRVAPTDWVAALLAHPLGRRGRRPRRRRHCGSGGRRRGGCDR